MLASIISLGKGRYSEGRSLIILDDLMIMRTIYDSYMRVHRLKRILDA